MYNIQRQKVSIFNARILSPFCRKSHTIAMEYKITRAPPSLLILQSSFINKRQNLAFCTSVYQLCTSCRLITAWQSQSWKMLYHQGLLAHATIWGCLSGTSKGTGDLQDRPYQLLISRSDASFRTPILST